MAFMDHGFHDVENKSCPSSSVSCITLGISNYRNVICFLLTHVRLHMEYVEALGSGSKKIPGVGTYKQDLISLQCITMFDISL